MIEVFALAIEHADHFISHHQRDCQLRAGGLRRGNIARIFAYVRSVKRPLLLGCRAGNAVADRHVDLVVTLVPADLAAYTELLCLFVQKKDGHVLQMKVIPRNHQDALQDLIQVEGREYRLAGVV